MADVKAYTAVSGDYAGRNDVRCFTGEFIFERPVMEAKRYKVLPHLFFPNDDITIWIDGNIWLQADSRTIADVLLGDADIAAFRHPYRETVWREFAVLKDDPRFAIPYLQKQLAEQWKTYRAEGLPINTALFECSVLIRRNNARVNRLMDAWWSQICRWQWRDQVSFPYVLWKYGDGVKVNAINGNARAHSLFKHVEQWPTATSV